jgi:hypothetical protein
MRGGRLGIGLVMAGTARSWKGRNEALCGSVWGVWGVLGVWGLWGVWGVCGGSNVGHQLPRGEHGSRGWGGPLGTGRSRCKEVARGSPSSEACIDCRERASEGAMGRNGQEFRVLR